MDVIGQFDLDATKFQERTGIENVSHVYFYYHYFDNLMWTEPSFKSNIYYYIEGEQSPQAYYPISKKSDHVFISKLVGEVSSQDFEKFLMWLYFNRKLSLINRKELLNQLKPFPKKLPSPKVFANYNSLDPLAYFPDNTFFFTITNLPGQTFEDYALKSLIANSKLSPLFNIGDNRTSYVYMVKPDNIIWYSLFERFCAWDSLTEADINHWLYHQKHPENLWNQYVTWMRCLWPKSRDLNLFFDGDITKVITMDDSDRVNLYRQALLEDKKDLIPFILHGHSDKGLVKYLLENINE